ncbi:hypothetical protein ON010_g17582 [Phytophthora cinnamomi]|nr:hypothetical protein ON010_g17582 [Phytophthora cinnamomi]
MVIRVLSCLLLWAGAFVSGGHASEEHRDVAEECQVPAVLLLAGAAERHRTVQVEGGGRVLGVSVPVAVRQGDELHQVRRPTVRVRGSPTRRQRGVDARVRGWRALDALPSGHAADLPLDGQAVPRREDQARRTGDTRGRRSGEIPARRGAGQAHGRPRLPGRNRRHQHSRYRRV